MLSYHLRTREPSPYDFWESFTLDSLFIPEARILIGYAIENKREGGILSYPYALYSGRMKALVNGEKECEGEPVRGEFVSKIDLHNDLVSKIEHMYHPNLLENERVYHITKNIRLNWDYQRSTKELIYILSGGKSEEEYSGGKRASLPKLKISIPILRPVSIFR